MEIRHIGSATRIDVPAGSSVGGRSAEFTFSIVGKGPAQLENVFAGRADKIIDSIRSFVSEEGNINLMGKSVAGKHFTGMWSQDISKRLAGARANFG